MTLDAVRQAIRDATLPKIALPPVLTPQEWLVARRLARVLTVPTVEETAEAMRIEIPLPVMPEPRVFEQWRPTTPPSWMGRRRQRRQALEAERRGNLIVTSAPEIRPARSIEQIFMDAIVGDRNRQDQQWVITQGSWALPDLRDRQVEAYGLDSVARTFDLPEEMLRPRMMQYRFVEIVLGNGAIDCPCPACVEWRQQQTQPEQTEEERIEAAGERYRNRSAKDFLAYSAGVLDDWESSDAARWVPPEPEGKEMG